MSKRLKLLAFSVCALATGSAAAAPEPAVRPDPQALEALVESLAAQSRAALPRDASPLQDRLAPAERLGGALARVEPARLDPNLVVSAIAQ
jgi:hypothetical protein